MPRPVHALGCKDDACRIRRHKAMLSMSFSSRLHDHAHRRCQWHVQPTVKHGLAWAAKSRIPAPGITYQHIASEAAHLLSGSCMANTPHSAKASTVHTCHRRRPWCRRPRRSASLHACFSGSCGRCQIMTRAVPHMSDRSALALSPNTNSLQGKGGSTHLPQRTSTVEADSSQRVASA